jgi:putative drug exporter of the RND superfamily
MLSMLSTERLARSSASHPKRTLVIWLVVLIAAFGAIATLVEGTMTTEFHFFGNPESKRADLLLETRLGRSADVNEVIIVRSSTVDVSDASYRAFVEELRTDVAELGSSIVASVVSYYQTDDESMVSADRLTTIMPILMAGEFIDAESNVKSVLDIVDEANGGGTFEVFITGESTFSRDFVEGNQADAEKGEAFGIPIALVILAVLFGALAAAVLPVMLAVTSIIVAFGIVLVVGQVIQVQAFAQNLITMIGLAVGIDYSLFVVSRFREERARGLPKLDAIEVAGKTASRAVLFSGITVVLAVLGVLIVPDRVFFSVGLGMITVVTVAVAASLTLLPAVLSLMGDNVDRFKLPYLRRRQGRSAESQEGFWYRLTYAVMRQPAISLVLAAGLLIAATVPYFDINTGTSGVSDLPDHFRAKQGFEVIQEEFGFGLNAPAEVVIDGDIDSDLVKAAIGKLDASLQSDPNFGATAVSRNESGDLLLLSVPLSAGPSTEESISSVRKLRDDYIPGAFSGVSADVLVTGTTASEIDFVDMGRRYLPIVLALVLGLSFVLLTVVFRSIVIPVTAIIMNLLSVGAAYGILVLVWQKGVGNEIFGFPQVDVIQAWLPIMMFAILFGLSMDYQVFLISRIRERYLQTGDNDEAVAYGLRSTAGLITGAALIMVAIFAGFAAGDLIPTSQFGFGMAIAILLDATIIRSVLVPSTMKLLGERNWYLPGFMSGLPQLQTEDPVLEPQPAAGGDA